VQSVVEDVVFTPGDFLPTVGIINYSQHTQDGLVSTSSGNAKGTKSSSITQSQGRLSRRYVILIQAYDFYFRCAVGGRASLHFQI